MPQSGLQLWGRGQGWDSRVGGQREQDCVQQGAGGALQGAGTPRYCPRVGNPRFVEFIGVFRGDCGRFIHSPAAVGHCMPHPCREERETREALSNLSW